MNYDELLNLIDRAESSTFTSFEINFENANIKLSKLDSPSFTEKMSNESVKEETVVVKKEVKEAVIENKEGILEDDTSGNIITSPIVGTFYASPSTDKPPFVKVGDSVEEGDVLCIIEAMKVMNEIKSKYTGTVKKVLLENESIVEYNQPIFVIG